MMKSTSPMNATEQRLLKAQESLSLVENSIESGMPEDFIP